MVDPERTRGALAVRPFPGLDAPVSARLTHVIDCPVV